MQFSETRKPVLTAFAFTEFYIVFLSFAVANSPLLHM